MGASPRINVRGRSDGQLDFEPDPERGADTNAHRVSIDAVGSLGTKGLMSKVGDTRRSFWNYRAGGYSVLTKWLSYRAGETLSPVELDEFTPICRRLAR